MYPTLTMGSWSINMHTLFNGIAGMLLFIYGWWRLQQVDLPRGLPEAVDAFFYGVCGAISGAWVAASLPALLLYWEGHTEYSRWWANGNQWMGVLAGATLAIYLYYRRRGLPAGRALDLGATALPLGQAVGRIGCILYGDAYGRVTDRWPAMYLPDSNGVWAYRYPTQLADMLANLAIFGLLLVLEPVFSKAHRQGKKRPFEGFLYCLYIFLYAVQRFFFEFWRGDMPLLAGPFTWTHLYCLAAMGLSAWVMWQHRDSVNTPAGNGPKTG